MNDSFSSTTTTNPISISELNRQVRQLLEVSFMEVWVTGEVSNFSRPASGHWYFSLKDACAQVRCAMFRNRNLFIKNRPKDGEQITLRAKVSLYEGRGEFQLIAESMESAGDGALRQAFEELKNRLSKEGLFAADDKKPIPTLPKHLGVITSPTGAVVHDILTVLKRRFPALPVSLIPTPVQGEEAPAAISAAIALANEKTDCDVLIVGRGGGSLEDLWAFNTEEVARAISASSLPIVSAVGHETDVSIADLVADLRAPTPSVAAEKVSPERSVWQTGFANLSMRMESSLKRLLKQHTAQLENLRSRLKHPGRRLQENAQRLDELQGRLERAMHQNLNVLRQELINLHQRLKLASPNSNIKSCYDQNNKLNDRLYRAIQGQIDKKARRFRQATTKLNAISPLATLSRGYSITTSQSGAVISSSDQVNIGDQITVRLHNGKLTSTVNDVIEENQG